MKTDCGFFPLSLFSLIQLFFGLGFLVWYRFVIGHCSWRPFLHPSIRSRYLHQGVEAFKVAEVVSLDHFYRILTIKPNVKTAQWVVRRWFTLIISGSIVKCKRIDSYHWCRSISDACQCWHVDLAWLASSSLSPAFVHSSPPQSLSLTLSQSLQVQKYLHPTRERAPPTWSLTDERRISVGERFPTIQTRFTSLFVGLWNWQVFARQCIMWFEGQQSSGSLIFYFIN